MGHDDRNKKAGHPSNERPAFKDSRKMMAQTKAAEKSTPNASAPKVAVRPQQQKSAIAVSDRSPVVSIGWAETNEIMVMVPLPCSVPSAVKSPRRKRLTATCTARVVRR
jgi:hypothetical protein